jgi:hypothetical protein
MKAYLLFDSSNHTLSLLSNITIMSKCLFFLIVAILCLVSGVWCLVSNVEVENYFDCHLLFALLMIQVDDSNIYLILNKYDTNNCRAVTTTHSLRTPTPPPK